MQQLALLSAENEVMHDVAFESIIQNFADIKTRKRVIAQNYSNKIEVIIKLLFSI